MALLTKSADVGSGAWVNLGTALALADDAWYELEVQDVSATGFGHVRVALTDDNNAPAADADGSFWYPRTAGSDANREAVQKKAAVHIWARSSGPAMRVVANPTYARA